MLLEPPICTGIGSGNTLPFVFFLFFFSVCVVTLTLIPVIPKIDLGLVPFFFFLIWGGGFVVMLGPYESFHLYVKIDLDFFYL